MVSMLLFFNVYVQENDNCPKKKTKKTKKGSYAKRKNNCQAKDLIHLHLQGKLPLDYQRHGPTIGGYFTY